MKLIYSKFFRQQKVPRTEPSQCSGNTIKNIKKPSRMLSIPLWSHPHYSTWYPLISHNIHFIFPYSSQRPAEVCQATSQITQISFSCWKTRKFIITFRFAHKSSKEIFLPSLQNRMKYFTLNVKIQPFLLTSQSYKEEKQTNCMFRAVWELKGPARTRDLCVTKLKDTAQWMGCWTPVGLRGIF